jgi:hypothetical protein
LPTTAKPYHAVEHEYLILIVYRKESGEQDRPDKRLAELMIEFGVAVATDATYTVKRIDNDFFEAI